MDTLTGYKGKLHVRSELFRMLLIGIFGTGSYILPIGNEFSYTLESNNLLVIKTGMMTHHGNVSYVDSKSGDQVTLTNGTQGMKRIDLVVNRYSMDESTGVESNEWVHIPGTPDASAPVAPAYTEGNVMDGDLVDDCPVFKIELDGLNITKITKLVPEHPGLQRQITGGTEEPSGGNDGDVYIQYEEE